MRPWICCFLLAFELTSFADGKVFALEAIREPVTIPDQRALICWSNGVERLVIETHFTGEGDRFAWVVPLPSLPVIEQASDGLFPTLEYLFRPELKFQVPRFYLGVLVALGFAFLIWRVKPGQKLGWQNWLAYSVASVALAAANPAGIALVLLLGACIIMVRYQTPLMYLILILTLLAFLIVPLFIFPRSRAVAGPIEHAVEVVEVLNRDHVGVFDTVTISGKDPAALQNWLAQNGYSVSSNATPVIADYVKRGWVFVGAKISRKEPGMATAAIHPLSFTFSTKEPVYPMKLTGVDSPPVSVELYVFGPARATAAGFSVKSCQTPLFPEAPRDWANRKSPGLSIYPQPLRNWCGNTHVATRLLARVSPAEMREDLVIGWEPFREKTTPEFSYAGALNHAANWASVALLLGAIAWVGIYRNEPRFLKRATWSIVGAVLVVAALMYVSVDKVAVKIQRARGPDFEVLWLGYSLDDEYASIDEVRTNILKYLPDSEWGRNSYLGGKIREQESPGNYSIREAEGRFEIIGYDANAAPHVLSTMSKVEVGKP